jgi:hypothetical protein
VLYADALHAFALIKPNKYEVIALAEGIRSRLGLGPLPDAETDAAASGGSGSEGGSSSASSHEGSPPVGEEEAGDGSAVNSRLLVAAQTVLGAMLRTGGLATPLSASAEKIARKGLTVEAATAAALHGRRGGGGGSGGSVGGAAQAEAGGGGGSPCGLIDGRKHVLVSLGEDGVLWLSARPVADAAAADLALVLPFLLPRVRQT